MKDQKIVSNEFHELEYVAKKFNLPVWQVMKAKEELDTDLRSWIEGYLEALPVPVVITDEDILNGSATLNPYGLMIKRDLDGDYINSEEVVNLIWDGFQEGAKWMRDQLKGEVYA